MKTHRSETPTPTLLQFARLAYAYMEALIDDEFDLPATLPSPLKAKVSAANPSPANAPARFRESLSISANLSTLFRLAQGWFLVNIKSLTQ